MMRRTALVGALSLWIPAVCWAGPEILTIGDEAPAVDIAHWLKGTEVEEFETGKIYVLEFWATWCGPCKASIPHVSELQEQYKDYDVTFIGVSDEKVQTVVGFLCKADKEDVLWNEKIHYTLATDPDRSTADAYMKPAAQQFIPTAFIIGKDTRIEWIGSPRDMDDVLAGVVRDEWDREAFKIEFEEKLAPTREVMKVQPKIDAAVKAGDWNAAIITANQLSGSHPASGRLKSKLFRTMLRESDDFERTYDFGRTLMRANWDDPSFLNSISWTTVDDKDVKKRDLEFALEAALRANELTEEKEAAILDTLARVYFEKGDLKQAIKWQREAVKQAGGSPMAEQLEEALKKYEEVAESRL
ncbi:MAG: redoxin domain-containing protein [Planctomycetota bacterium]|jgi:thiol-disulfide isomerase/thioredoxin